MQVVFDKIPIELLVVASVHTWDEQSYRRRLPIYTITQNRQKVDNCVWCQSPKLRRRQIFYKKHIWPSIWRPQRYRHPKWKNPRTGQSSTIMQIFKPISARYQMSPSKKIIFPYRGLPWGLPFHAIHYWKALLEQMLCPIWHVTLRFTVFDIFAIKISNFGATWGYSKRGDDLSGTHIYHHAKFHADRLHLRQDIRPHTKIYTQTADLISGKSHTRVAFVDKKQQTEYPLAGENNTLPAI